MEGPTPISALIHAATMVAAGIFLVARLLPLFRVIPFIMNLIALIGIITLLLGATFALVQKDIKRGLAYSTMSQLGYMMLALGMGSYRAALFHLITHAYSKALLFLGSGSIIHSMETIVGYSPDKSQNMVLMGGLRKHVPITKTAFLLGTLSLCGIPPLACFWSKDEILNDSWLYSPIFAIIAWSTAGLTAFYMFRIYLLTFEGHLNVHFQTYSGKKKSPFYSISLWGKEGPKVIKKKNSLLALLTMNNNQRTSFFCKKTYRIDSNVTSITQPFSTISRFGTKNTFSYPHESDNTMLFPMLVLVLFTLFIGVIGIPLFNQFNQEGGDLDILSKLLTPTINLLHQNHKNSVDWYEFMTNATFSVSIAFFGILIASFLYKPAYSSLQNLNFFNSVVKSIPKKTNIWGDKLLNVIYDWSYNRGYIDLFYAISLTRGIRGLAQLTHFFDKRVIDGITNGVGIRCVLPGPLVLGKGPLNALTPTPDMDRTVSRRSEPSSRTALMGEQPNPWNILQPQVAKSRHRGFYGRSATPGCRRRPWGDLVVPTGWRRWGRSNLLVPAERKKNFTFFLSGREDLENPIDCSFLQTSGKSMKKGSNGTIPPSPQNEKGDLVVLGL
ncbi:hypothetical protein FNV43_RR05876 [Rhamnella rubrinervis]|uniref:NAD(P)H-quinone oxidoreductase subunit 5, chloroplastic n=1 Tax=Rhamnella rubrinervis TaxID=2594499 RepID=A0A8K0ML84_9ROSA|nr:hypothetical protein FNV43_RR05876 [Rhamnella rubrinervis]